VSKSGGPAALGSMTFFEHLAELRRRLIWMCLAVAVGAVVTFAMWNQLLDVMLEPYCRAQDLPRSQCTLKIIDPVEGFVTRSRVAVYGGIALGMPVILWQVWRFVTPALYPREKRFVVPFVVSALALFGLGVAIGYWTLEKALDFLITISGDQVETFFRPASYINFVTFMLLAFGVSFEIPIVLLFLQLAHVVTPATLARVRRYAFIGIVVFAAIITPSGDPVSLFAMSLPLYFFYELSIVAGRLVLGGAEHHGKVRRLARKLPLVRS
jgi:sec-independent protein translocase protein TatC